MAIFQGDKVSAKSQGFIRKFFNILQIFVVIGAILAVIYLFIFSPHEVTGKSMEPNYHQGEFLLADKISIKFKEQKRGDVVIFQFDDNTDYIKRVIAVAGETVEIKDGLVYVNDTLLDESSYLSESTRTNSGRYLSENIKFRVPDNMVIAMGDNRSFSADSRDFGPIMTNQIKGKVIIRVTPLSDFGFIKDPKY